MRIPARIKIGLLALAVAAFAAVLLLAVLPTAIANSREVRRLLTARLEAETGAAVDFAALRVHLLPRPCATLADLRLSWPRGMLLEAPRLRFCLDLASLLGGKIALQTLELEAPALRAVLPGTEASLPALPDPAACARIAAEITGLLPAARIAVRGGRLLLHGQGGEGFRLQGLDLTLEAAGEALSGSLAGTADGIASFRLTGTREAKTGRTHALLEAQGIEPARLQAAFREDAPVRIAGGQIDRLEAELDCPTGETVSLTLAAAAPRVELERRGRSAALAIERFAARLEREGPRSRLTISDLTLRAPAAALSLEAVVDERLSPRIRVEIAGRTEVEGVREAALALLGEMEDVRRIFEVLRAGEAPEVEVRLAGDTWAELDRLGTLFLRGRLEGGAIHLPWVELDLEEVSGEARIEGGVLHGRGLSARTLGALGTEGSLDVGLSADDPVLALDIAIAAELSPLPGVLARLVRIPAFREQMGLVREVSGTARGRLTLRGTHEDVDVSVQAADLDLRGRYLPLPGPIAVRGGLFALEGREVRLSRVEAAVGASRASGLTFRCHEDPEGVLRIEAAAGTADLDLVEAGLIASRLLPENGLAVRGGRVRLREVRVAGMPRDPGTWRLSAAGDLRELSLEAAFLPGALKVDSARLEFLGDRLAFQGPAVELASSRAAEIAGALGWGKEPEIVLRAARAALAVQDLAGEPGVSPEGTPEGLVLARDVEARIPLPPRGAEGLVLRAAIEEAAIENALPGKRLALRAGGVGVAQGRMRLDGKEVALGGSTARGAVLEYEPDRRLRVAVEEARIEAAELLEALRRHPGAAAEVAEIASADGALRLFETEIALPLDGAGAAHLALQAVPEDFRIAFRFLGSPLRLVAGRLRAEPGEGRSGEIRLALEGIEAGLGPSAARIDGTVVAAGGEIRLALDLTASVLDLGRLAEDLEALSRRRSPGRPEATGRIGLAAERALLGDIEIAPLRLRFDLEPGGGIAWIERGALCGMLFMGRVGFSGDRLDAYLVPVVDARPLEETVLCLTREASVTTGNFNLEGALHAAGKAGELLQAAAGRFSFIAEDGVIRKSPFFARLFSILNLTELYRGSLPDFESGGFAYKRSTADLELREGTLTVHEWVIDGPTLWMGGRGKIDLRRRDLDFTLMVSPFKTIDRIINRIPGLRWILGGRLVAVPMKATGELRDPKIVPLAPQAVGTSLLEMLKRTILLPVRILQPFIPGMEPVESGTITR